MASLSIAAIGAIVSAAGSVVSTITGVLSASAQAKAAEAEAKSIGLAAQSQERRERRANEKVLARQRAIAGASGVVSSEGSSLTTLLDSVKEGKLNELVIRQQGEQARQNKLAEARAARGTIGGTILGGVVGVASSVLGGFMGGKVTGLTTKGATSGLRKVSTGSGFRRGFGVRRPLRIGI